MKANINFNGNDNNQNNVLLNLFFFLSFLLGSYITFISLGLTLLAFSVVIIPIYLFHFFVGVYSLELTSKLKYLIFTSNLFFLLFALIRPDCDFLGGRYTGVSCLAFEFGLRDSRRGEFLLEMRSGDTEIFIALTLLVVVAILDIIILVKSRRLNKKALTKE